MSKSGLFASLSLLLASSLLAACTALEPGAPSDDERSLIGGIGDSDSDGDSPRAIDPSAYHCEPMLAAARGVVPPPPPSAFVAAAVPAVPAACPPGQVPFYDQPAAPKVPASPPPSDLSTQVGTYWYASVMKATESFNRSGVGGPIYFSNPAVFDQNDMVTAEMSIVFGANYHLVEVGLRKFWDAFPRLMISQWAFGTFNDAAGFIRVHPTYAPGMPLTPYYGVAVQHYVRYDAGNWWVWFNDGWVGYFPGTLWSGGFTYGDVAHFYGEVFSALNRVPPLTDMGNGLFSSNPSSAFMQDICMHATTPDCYFFSSAPSTFVSNAAYYSLSYANFSMRFGGNGGG